MSDYLKWYFCYCWLIKYVVKDWMIVDVNKFK